MIEHNFLGLQYNNGILQASAGFQMAKFDFISQVKNIWNVVLVALLGSSTVSFLLLTDYICWN